MVNKRVPYILAAITVLLWGTLSTVYKLLIKEMDAMFVLAVSCWIAAAALFIYNIIRGNFKNFKKCSILDIIVMCILGVLGYFVYNWFYMLGLELLPAQQAMVLNYLWPTMIIVFSCVFLAEKFTLYKAGAVILSIIGVAIVAVNGDTSALINSNLKGVLYCLIAAVSYGLYSVLNKKETYHKELAIFVAYIVTAIISTVVVIVNHSYINVSMSELLGLTYNGVFISAAGYSMWMLALEWGNTAIISNMAYLCPFVALLCTSMVLDEKITIYSLLGLIFIMLGITIQIFGERKNTKAEG